MKCVSQSSHPDDAQLQALLWGELEETRAAEVRSHLESCSACREALEELKEFAAVIGPPSDRRELEAGHYLAESIVARARADRWRKTAASALAASLVLATAGAMAWNSSRSPGRQEFLAQAPTVALRSGLRATTKITLASNVELVPIKLVPPFAVGDRLYDLEVRDESDRMVVLLTQLRGRGDHVFAILQADTLRSGGLFRLTLSRQGEPLGEVAVSVEIEAISD